MRKRRRRVKRGRGGGEGGGGGGEEIRKKAEREWDEGEQRIFIRPFFGLML